MRKNTNIADELLVIQYQSGNKIVLAELVKRWHKIFCNKAYWLVKDKDVAKDIAQDSWKIIMDKLPNLKEPKRFGSWATRIVYNKSLDWIKNKAKERIQNQNYYNEQFIDVEETNNEQIKKKLLQGIKTLPTNQQMIIQLFYVEEYSLKEISELLKISTGTVKSRLFHAREKLKQILKEK